MTITTPPPPTPTAPSAQPPPAAARPAPLVPPTWSAARVPSSPAAGPPGPARTVVHDLRERPLTPRRPPVAAAAPWGHGTGPFSTLSVAADAAVRELARQAPLDLWLVTHLDGDRQRLLATAGPWAERAGSEDLGWQAGLCARLVAEGGAGLVRDLACDPAYRARAVGRSLVPASWVGVPLVSAHGALFGALCGMGATASVPGLSGALEPAQVMGRMLSTIIAGEQVVARWAAAAAAERARGERDRLTGLLDRHGWTAALGLEHRPPAPEDPVSLLVLDVDDLRSTNGAEGHEAGDAVLLAVAGVLRDTCSPQDLLARVDGDEFAVLAGCDAVSARVLTSRLKVRLGAAGVSASVGWAVRRPREVLSSTWERAEQAMAVDKSRHHRR